MTLKNAAVKLQAVRDELWPIAQLVSNLNKPLTDNNYGRLCGAVDQCLEAMATASTWAVTNTHTGTMVGCYTKAKAEQLRDEWNALAMKARKEQPYAIVGLAVVAS